MVEEKDSSNQTPGKKIKGRGYYSAQLLYTILVVSLFPVVQFYCRTQTTLYVYIKVQSFHKELTRVFLLFMIAVHSGGCLILPVAPHLNGCG